MVTWSTARFQSSLRCCKHATDGYGQGLAQAPWPTWESGSGAHRHWSNFVERQEARCLSAFNGIILCDAYACSQHEP